MGFFDTLGKAANGLMGMMDKDMKNQVRRMTDSQLRQLANKGNTYAAEELRRRGK